MNAGPKPTMNVGPKPPANNEPTEHEPSPDREPVADLEPTEGDLAGLKGGQPQKAVAKKWGRKVGAA